MKNHHSFTSTPIHTGIAAILATTLLAFLLAWVSSGFQSITQWGSFLGVLAAADALLLAGWFLLRREAPPCWLGRLLIGAALLRLVLGVVWYTTLPVIGQGSPEEKGGYVMADAHDRDITAWKMAQSGKPLWYAFSGNRKADQYGGMLFLSMALYRFFGGESHQPLLVVAIAAAFSALAVIFAWAFSRRLWGEKAAAIAAWGIALYPEAALLGSSQMREAFVIPLAVIAFYGLACYQQEPCRRSLGWLVIPVLLVLPFSPPYATALAGFLALSSLSSLSSFIRERRLSRTRDWLVLAGIGLLISIGLWLALKQFAPDRITNPVAVLSWWVKKSADWQAYLSQHASGWMQKVFKTTPEWAHLPLLIGYGVLQPFLPATLIAHSNAPIWTVITIWRAAGWTILLVFLLYALFRTFSGRIQSGTRLLTFAVWIGIIFAAFRGGSDLWDNPRYRAAFAGLQMALAAWAWVDFRQSQNPWFRRILATLAGILFWFIPWYLRRYTGFDWPVVDLFKTIGLGVATGVLYSLWDWARNRL